MPVTRPNVLLVCIDALRADRLGLYGASPSPSPNMDSLARDSVVFENATSVASWTKPSVPSLLTGLYPAEHGVFDNSGKHVDTLASTAVPLAEILRDNGYRTAAFVENDQLLRGISGLDRGFSLYFDRAGRPPEIADRFLSWMEQADGMPWFAYLHVLDPHFPYTPDEFAFAPEESARLRIRVRHWDLRGDFWWLLRRRVNEGSMALDKQALADLERLYSLETASVDAVIGRMLRLMDASGVLDETLVIVTSDHGEGFLEHGRLDHGYGPYEELLRVPLVMRFPQREHRGQRIGTLAQTVDVAPTVLARAGLNAPATWSSVSLLPTLDGAGSVARSFAFAHERHGQWELISVRDSRYSYLRSQGETTTKPATPVVPASAAVATRLRAHGIFDGAVLVAGLVKRIAPGDMDTELYGPIESVDVAARTVRILGVTVRIASGVPEESEGESRGMLTLENLRPGDPLRVHGSLLDGVFVPAKLERPESGSIEVEGVVRSLQVRPGGDVAVDLGGVSFVADPRATWRDFPGAAPAPPAKDHEVTEAPLTEKLFDRSSDPREQRDLAAENPAELTRMRALADRVSTSFASPPRGEARRATPDEQTREKLRALGYMD